MRITGTSEAVFERRRPPRSSKLNRLKLLFISIWKALTFLRQGSSSNEARLLLLSLEIIRGRQTRHCFILQPGFLIVEGFIKVRPPTARWESIPSSNSVHNTPALLLPHPSRVVAQQIILRVERSRQQRQCARGETLSIARILHLHPLLQGALHIRPMHLLQVLNCPCPATIRPLFGLGILAVRRWSRERP